MPTQRDTQGVLKAPLNLLPSGLLSFFGLKQFGKSPAYLSEDLYGMMDLREFYAGNVDIQQTSGPALATGTTGFVTAAGTVNTVPDGEAWLLLGYTVRFNGIAAGDFVEFAPTMSWPQAGAQMPDLLSPPWRFTGTAVVSGVAVGMDPANRWRIARAGNVLGVHVNHLQCAAGNANPIYTRMVARLQI